MTTHSLAYANTIKPYHLTVGIFNWKSIKERISYEIKLMIIEIMNDFCLSKYVNFDTYIDSKKDVKDQMNSLDTRIIPLAKKYLHEMMSGKISITHAGYLKMYHMLLTNNQIKHKKFDFLALDECGDINPVTLEIFKLLPATKKIMVGDENQNIYTFNKTINGFEAMKDEGLQLNMTRSFRCDPSIARRIELFSRKYIDPNMEFKGTKSEDSTTRTKAIISRTNSALIGEIIELLKMNEKFNLTRKSSVIFELILIMINLKPGGKIFSTEWKFIQEDVDEWDRDLYLQESFRTPLAYITYKYAMEPAIKTSMGIISKYGIPDIYNAYEYAKKHENEKNHAITLCTAHSSKGLEFDIVEITNDMNNSIEELIEEQKPIEEYTKGDLESMRLYYVACSRATKVLKNAKWLPIDTEN